MSGKMRKEFEEWINKSAVFKNPEWLESVGQYNYTSTQVMWEAWQASRQSLVVKLPVTVCRTFVFEIPHTSEVGMEHGEYFEVNDIEKTLDAAGVRYE